MSLQKNRDPPRGVDLPVQQGTRRPWRGVGSIRGRGESFPPVPPWLHGEV